jgi:hypothetical protein
MNRERTFAHFHKLAVDIPMPKDKWFVWGKVESGSFADKMFKLLEGDGFIETKLKVISSDEATLLKISYEQFHKLDELMRG